MENIKAFWINSYTSNKKAFFFELTSFIFTVIASLTLAVTANNPNMSIIYPGFFVGSLSGCYAYYLRGIAWPMLLTAYFAVTNVFGFGRAIGWW